MQVCKYALASLFYKIQKEKLMQVDLTSMSKSDRTLHWFEQVNHVQFQCIHCQEVLTLNEKSLTCPNGHQFDMSKQGYYFLAHKSMSNRYDQALFSSRRLIITHSNLYHQLHRRLIELVSDDASRPLAILDAGSGEGSHLQQLKQHLPVDSQLIGIDLAKAGIQLASDYNGHMLSLVADLTQLPFANQQFDVILSILSPANYEEFNRVLKPNGHLIKIVPNAGYLKEIRNKLAEFGHLEDESYDNTLIVETFMKHYADAKVERIQDTVDLTSEQMQALIEMTPLTWRLSEEQRKDLLDSLGLKITLDVTVLIHRKK